MKEKKFKHFLSNYRDNLNRYYKPYLSYIKRHIVICIMAILTMTILPSLFVLHFKNITNNYLVVNILLTLYNLSVITYFIYSLISTITKKSYKINNDIINDILIYKYKKVSYLPKNRIKKSDLIKSNIFNLDNLKYSGENYIKMFYNKNYIIVGDVDLDISSNQYKQGYKKYFQTSLKKKQKILFNGLYFETSFHKNNNTFIYLITKNNNNLLKKDINQFINFKQNKIKLVNIELGNNYKIYSNDKIKTRDILDIGYTEKINNINKLFPQNKYSAFKNDGTISIFIEDVSTEYYKNRVVPLRKAKLEKHVFGIYKYINSYLELYNILNEI